LIEETEELLDEGSAGTRGGEEGGKAVKSSDANGSKRR